MNHDAKWIELRMEIEKQLKEGTFSFDPDDIISILTEANYLGYLEGKEYALDSVEVCTGTRWEF